MPNGVSLASYHRVDQDAEQLSPRPPMTVLLHEVPRIALPTDVLRALRDARVVGDNFPLSRSTCLCSSTLQEADLISPNIVTPLPISLPRRASLTTSYHVQCDNPTHTEAFYHRISTQPLFSTAASRPVPNAYSRHSSMNNPLNFREHARVQFVDCSASEWVASQLRLIEVQSERDAHRRADGFIQSFDREWVTLPSMSGRRVLLKGLPAGIPLPAVREMAKNFGLDTGPDAVTTLPQ